MKKGNIYTLTLDWTTQGGPKDQQHWVRLTHREAMKKLHHAQEHGTKHLLGFSIPLQSWKLDSGWQASEPVGRVVCQNSLRPMSDEEIDYHDSYDRDWVE